ncbi:MAG: hypothetical protein MUO34_12090 [Ignavibacteriaceae bacterium]|nr:hypothetical protein [Ignavibacteriaceae bacterium]
MKKYQKFILPTLLVILLVLIYSVYFSKSNVLGSFSDFDANNSAVKDIRVLVLQDRGIQKDTHGGAVFYAADKNNTVYPVSADKIPSGLEFAETAILRGHLNKDAFHAHDVLID